MSLKIRNMGIETPHDCSFKINRPCGMGVCAFLQTLTPCNISVRKSNAYGLEYEHADGTPEPYDVQVMHPGECIIYTPTFPRLLTINSDVLLLRNNWIHFDCPKPNDYFSELGIPLNTLFNLRSSTLVSSMLDDMISEHLQMNSNWERMEGVLLEEFLIKLSRSYLPLGKAYIDDRRQMDDLTALRRDIYLNPERNWSVASMAINLIITQNRFIALYSQLFGVTPKHDVVNARVQKAKMLMYMETISIRDIAHMSGFQNEYYFSTVFKRITGMTPNEYRRNLKRFVSDSDYKV